MSSIVCAVDDSLETPTVVRVARELAQAFGLRLLLVHVAPPTEAPGVSAAPAGQERLREAERGDAADLLRRLATREGLGEEVELRARVGPPAPVIVAAAQEEAAAFVVLGSRGLGDVKSALLGSVSHAVAGTAPCPVVIVPPGAPEREPE
jgi:nucleotide-binding universal stress UspA family protein